MTGPFPSLPFVDKPPDTQVEHRASRTLHSEGPTVRSPALFHLVVTWALLIPLSFLASNGGFWFQTAAINNPLSAASGSLVNGHHFFQTLLVLLAVFSIVGILVFGKIHAIARILLADRLFLALCALAVASSLWSQSPAATLQYALFLILDTCFIAYLLSRFTEVQQLHLFFLLGVFCLTFSFALSIAFPAFGIDRTVSAVGAWKGMYGQKNLAAMATLYLLPAAFFLPRSSPAMRLVRISFVLGSAAFIVMTQSKSSLLSLIALILFAGMLQWIAPLAPKARLSIGIACVLTLLASAALLTASWTDLVYALGKNPTLTGRTEIWAAVWNSVLKRPLLGYGYEAFWLGYTGESASVSFASGWSVPSAHNAVLEIWLSLGLVGVLMIAVMLVRTFRDAVACSLHELGPYTRWCCCLVFLTVIVNVDEGELLIPNSNIWSMFVLASMALAMKRTSARVVVASHLQESPHGDKVGKFF